MKTITQTEKLQRIFETDAPTSGNALRPVKTNRLNNSLHRASILWLLPWLAVAPQAMGQHFILSSTPAVGNTPTALVAADLNGDGRPELITANYSGNSLTVLAKGPDGLFATSATVFVEGNPYSLVAADVNGDGKLDAVTANDFSNSLTVLTNSGNGTLIFATNLHPGNRPLSVKAADFNGDGRLLGETFKRFFFQK